MARRFFCICAAFVVSLMGDAPCNASHTFVTSSSFQQHLKALLQLESEHFKNHESTRKFAYLFGKQYDELFSPLQKPGDLPTLDGADVGLLYLAASMTQFYTFDARYVHDMQLDLAELQTRGEATQSQYDAMYNALVASRQFSLARTFARMHHGPAMVRIPDFRDISNAGTTAPTAMVVSSDGRHLDRRSINLRKRAQIVVIIAPFCHFAQRGIRDIEADGTLRKTFRKNAAWLVPPNSATSFEAMEEWDRKHPVHAMEMAYTFQEWRMFERWQLPTFYFLKSGKVVAEVIGWPREGRKGEIRAALRRVGLL